MKFTEFTPTCKGRLETGAWTRLFYFFRYGVIVSLGRRPGAGMIHGVYCIIKLISHASGMNPVITRGSSHLLMY
jgi:hypothetical protein